MSLHLTPGTFGQFPAQMCDGLHPYQQLIFTWLCFYANYTTQECFPSLATLAKKCNLGVSTVKKHLKILEDMGYIQIMRRKKDKEWFSNLYKVIILNKPINSNVGCQNVIPHDNQMAPQVRLGKDRLTNSCSPDGERPSDLGKKEGRPTKENVKEQGFEEFWKLYPRKQGKVNALKSWKTKSCSTKTQAILASLSFRLSAAPPNGWAGIETNFVPLPATFLNQQRWEDTPVPAKVGDMPEDEKARRIEIFKAKEAWKVKRDRLSLIENIKHGRARDLRTLEEKAADVILEAEGLEEWDKSWD